MADRPRHTRNLTARANGGRDISDQMGRPRDRNEIRARRISKPLGRKHRDVRPWLTKMAELKIDHPEWSARKLAMEAAPPNERGPCTTRGALVKLLCKRWQQDGVVLTANARRQRQRRAETEKPMSLGEMVRLMISANQAAQDMVSGMKATQDMLNSFKVVREMAATVKTIRALRL